MAKPPIPIREVVKRSKRSRQAVYKALDAENLNEADLFGVRAVVDDHKLADFVAAGIAAAAMNGNKKSNSRKET